MTLSKGCIKGNFRIVAYQSNGMADVRQGKLILPLDAPSDVMLRESVCVVHPEVNVNILLVLSKVCAHLLVVPEQGVVIVVTLLVLPSVVLRV